MPTRLRLLDPADAEDLARLVTANRAHLRPYEPKRTRAYFTVQGQRAAAESKLQHWHAGTCAPFVILDDAGEVVGSLTLNDIVRGAFQNAHTGYWVSQHAAGRGLATQALTAAAEFAFTTLGLHRIQAATLPENVTSQRVLTKVGFTRFGTAPGYLRIDGAWREHHLFQLLAP